MALTRPCGHSCPHWRREHHLLHGNHFIARERLCPPYKDLSIHPWLPWRQWLQLVSTQAGGSALPHPWVSGIKEWQGGFKVTWEISGAALCNWSDTRLLTQKKNQHLYGEKKILSVSVRIAMRHDLDMFEQSRFRMFLNMWVFSAMMLQASKQACAKNKLTGFCKRLQECEIEPEQLRMRREADPVMHAVQSAVKRNGLLQVCKECNKRVEIIFCDVFSASIWESEMPCVSICISSTVILSQRGWSGFSCICSVWFDPQPWSPLCKYCLEMVLQALVILCNI